MWQRTNRVVAIFVVLFHLSTSAMVLPRPPSSPNHIRQDNDFSERKVYEGKALHGILQATNVERPDTEDYRLLEIELQSPDDMDAANLQGLVHAMLKNQQTEQTPETQPHPEVIPNSLLGVRDIGLTPNFRLSTFEDDKRVLLSPPKLRDFHEKLYYLKSGRPKVYVNVRGNSGAFWKDSSKSTSSENQANFLRATRPFERQPDWAREKVSFAEKKARPPKKFDSQVHGTDAIPKVFDRRAYDATPNKSVERVQEANLTFGKSDRNRGSRKYPTKNADSRMKGQASAYGLDDLSTTENSMVTSSELPKQIPAPPSKVPGRVSMVQTTPVQRYALRRTDILPGYGFSEE